MAAAGAGFIVRVHFIRRASRRILGGVPYLWDKNAGFYLAGNRLCVQYSYQRAVGWRNPRPVIPGSNDETQQRAGQRRDCGFDIPFLFQQSDFFCDTAFCVLVFAVDDRANAAPGFRTGAGRGYFCCPAGPVNDHCFFQAGPPPGF